MNINTPEGRKVYMDELHIIEHRFLSGITKHRQYDTELKALNEKVRK